MRLLLVAAIIASLTTAAAAQRPPVETLDVPSVTASDTQFLEGKAEDASPVTLAGRLYLPAADGTFPVVVMLHGSAGDGVLGYDAWVQQFTSIGVASFRLDSYGGRGLTEIYSNQGALGEFQVVYDAYRAIDILAQHPSIDPDRIGVIGFSRGGIGALYASLMRFESLYGSKAASFAVHLPFYPPCNFELEAALETTGAPIHAFHGTADEWNPAAPCRDYIAALAAAGADATFTEYPNALHAFDNTSVPAYNANPAAQTSRSCLRREQDGILINADTGTAFSWTDTCVENGPSQQYQGAAADAATARIKAILAEVFSLE